MSPLNNIRSDYEHHYHQASSSKIRNEINGQRPSPLKISKDSHLIRKPSHTSSSCFGQIKQQRQPVIIYAHSPKVIHTQARDFMALVQKLTGFTRSTSDHSENKITTEVFPAKEEQHQPLLLPPPPPPPSSSSRSLDDNDSLSAISDDYNNNNNNNTRQFFANIPLFTPNAVPDYFWSPKVGFRFPETGYVTPSPNNSISPSVLEFFKGLPDY